MGFDFFSPKQPVKIIFVGLDNSGKSSILKFLQGKAGSTAPTVGFGKEEFQHGQAKFEAMDMSGQSKYRNLWPSYASTVDGVVFVIDISDRLRFKVAKDQLRFLCESELREGVPFLFFLNKADLPDAAKPDQVVDMLSLKEFRRGFKVQPCSAKTGMGIQEGFKWLESKLSVSD